MDVLCEQQWTTFLLRYCNLSFPWSHQSLVKEMLYDLRIILGKKCSDAKVRRIFSEDLRKKFKSLRDSYKRRQEFKSTPAEADELKLEDVNPSNELMNSYCFINGVNVMKADPKLVTLNRLQVSDIQERMHTYHHQMSSKMMKLGKQSAFLPFWKRHLVRRQVQSGLLVLSSNPSEDTPHQARMIRLLGRAEGI